MKQTKAQRKARATLNARLHNLTLDDTQRLLDRCESNPAVPNELYGIIEALHILRLTETDRPTQTAMFEDDDLSITTRPPFQQYFA